MHGALAVSALAEIAPPMTMNMYTCFFLGMEAEGSVHPCDYHQQLETDFLMDLSKMNYELCAAW
jgi:hypothetical protein